MDATHLHLVLTHFPIVGTLLSVGILAYGLFIKNDTVLKVGFFVLIVMALITVPVYLSGEEAEETVEKISGVSGDIIENHEEFAEKVILLMGLLGLLSLVSLFAIIKRKAYKKTVTIITFVLSIITAGAFIQVGSLGGQIRHSEIRSEGVNQQGEHETGKLNRHEDDND